MDMRKCGSCGIFYWPPGRYFDIHRRRKDGLKIYCKTCVGQYQKDNRKRITERKRLWRKENIERLRPRRRNWLKGWRTINREVYLANQRDYHQRNKDSNNERTRLWKQNNPEWCATYQQSPQRKATAVRAQARRRESDKLADLTLEEWENILDGQEHKCNICGSIFCDELRPDRDHIIPVVMGGILTKTNVQALCRPCNSSKGVSIQ